MKVKILDSFSDKLVNQVEFIAQDKPKAAQKFRKEVIQTIKSVSSMPFKHRKSIYFNDEYIREVIYKGYTLVYKIDKDEILFFGFIKYEEKL
ncbi:MAG: type II toxin-antitoxin system RelE/ParE family toxin [Flavobacteriales bacterium]